MKKIIGLLVFFLPLSAFANVTFYGQCNYKGPGVEIGVGEYTAAELNGIGIPEDAIASIKVPAGFSVTLHENDGFKGRYGTLEKSDSCLNNNGFENLVSSLSIKSTKVVTGFGEQTTDLFGTTTLAPKKPLASAEALTVYADCGFAGRSAKLPAGDYNLAQLKKFGLGNNDISSVKMPKGMSITVYENDFLRGDSASASTDIKCIDTGSFANRITSVSVLGSGGSTLAAAPAQKIASGATVFTECAFKGTSAKLREGEYTNAELNALGIDNNSISSVLIADGYQIDMFINDFHRGTSGMLNTNNPCLVGRYNEAVTSVIVRKSANVSSSAPAVTLYTHCNYRGGSIQLPAGRYDRQALKNARIGENTVSSIKVNEGYRATIYDGAKFDAKSLVLSGDDDCLDNDDMNEKLSSMVIESTASRIAGKAGAFVAQPNQSNSSKSDDLIAGLTCVQEFVEKNVCDERRWATIERRCNLGSVDELSDGYLEGHVTAGNCNAELWDELVRRTANPHLR